METTHIHINPDKTKVKEIRNNIKLNGGYCPCALAHNKDTLCMCKEFRENIKSGYCHYGLYYKD